MCVLIEIKKFCSFLIENDYGAQASDWTSQFHHESETCCQFLKPWFIFFQDIIKFSIPQF